MSRRKGQSIITNFHQKAEERDNKAEMGIIPIRLVIREQGSLKSGTLGARGKKGRS